MKRIYLLAVILLLPIAFTSFIWLEVVRGVASRAVDGSGHFAIALIYDRNIYPDTFGWTNAYFAGMPFPNFYPPLFFWMVSLLHHSHLISFASAFKLMVAGPLILMPLASWAIVWFHGGRQHNAAIGAAVASATLYTLGELFQPNTGLDMSSTLLDGFYTQPLGYVLLLLWILVYFFPRQTALHFIGASILLALTVLANFFNAITAIIFIASVLGCDLVRWFGTNKSNEQSDLRRAFLVHFGSPWLALGLTAFWLVPMLSSYQYLVTRPLIRPLAELMTIPVWCWYILAALGAVIWLRRPTGRIGPYLIACLILFVSLVFAGSMAPTWFPLQVFRFFSTMNALLVVPIGVSIAYVIRLYVGRNHDAIPAQTSASRWRRWTVIVALTVVILVSLGAIMSTKKLKQAFAFYTPENFDRIAAALEFGKSHRDGRYLVEVLPPRAQSGPVRADSLALNAYLGAQGNETVTIVYREASPNSGFFNAELNAFSTYRENFGISSTLMDDIDFVNQPLPLHLQRLKFMGVRYLVVGTQGLKDRLAAEPELGTRHDIGPWTIFELRDTTLPNIRSLQYRPALVVSDFTLKLRRQNQYDFVRLAEEQFNDAWFDVLLVRSPVRKVDLLSDLDDFGALIIDHYDFQDEERALRKLRDFSRTRQLILLSSATPLFNRIKSSISEFPKAIIIPRPEEPVGDWVEAVEPSHTYSGSSIRSVWRDIKAALDKEKVSVNGEIKGQAEPDIVYLANNTSRMKIPVLLAQTYSPKWIRDDRQMVYAATPFFTLTFVNQSTRLVFTRDRYDRLALWGSLSALAVIVLWAGIKLARDLTLTIQSRRFSFGRQRQDNQS